MAGGGAQLQTGAAEVGATDAVVGERVSGCPDVRDFLRFSGAVSLIIWIGEVGYLPAHWEDLGRLPPKGGLYTYRTETVERTVWYVGVTSTIGGNGGGRPAGGGDLHCLPP